MENTVNYNLKKPGQDDFYNVADFNSNADIIDGALKTHDTQLAQNALGLETHKTDTTPHAETTAKIIYVDASFGDDILGNGTSGNPYKTVTKALSTLKKRLAALEIKIRVKPGDYRNEGTTNVTYFTGGMLTIVAFDGVNEINNPNDAYIFKKISVRECEQINLYGLKCVNSDSDYGIFINNVRYAHIKGYKNNDSTIVNSGVGVTRNSNVLIEDSLCANKSAVVSCNFGSKVVSKNWDVSSTGNVQGLIAHEGGQIHKIGIQPNATYADVYQGGVIFDEYGNIVFSKYAQQVFVTRDMSLGDFDIAINLPILPKWIQLIATKSGTKMISHGQWSDNADFTIFTNNTGNTGVSYDAIQLNDGTGNTIKYNISNVTKTAISLVKTSDGEGITGNMSLAILCGF